MAHLPKGSGPQVQGEPHWITTHKQKCEVWLRRLEEARLTADTAIAMYNVADVLIEIVKDMRDGNE